MDKVHIKRHDTTVFFATSKMMPAMVIKKMPCRSIWLSTLSPLNPFVCSTLAEAEGSVAKSCRWQMVYPCLSTLSHIQCYIQCFIVTNSQQLQDFFHQMLCFPCFLTFIGNFPTGCWFFESHPSYWACFFMIGAGAEVSTVNQEESRDHHLPVGFIICRVLALSSLRITL